MSSDLLAAPGHRERRDLRFQICCEPDDTVGYLRLAKHLFPSKSAHISRKLAERILIIAPTNEIGLEQIAHYGHDGNVRADLKSFVRWCLVMPGHPAVYPAFSRLLRRTIFVEETHQVGRRAILFTPFDHDIYSLIARQLLKRKDLALAARYVTKAIILAPKETEPHITMAETAVEDKPLLVAAIAARRLQIVTASSARGYATAVIRDSRPAIFIHIPKTAGTAALRATAPYAMPLGHRWIESAPTPPERSYAAWVHPNLLLPPRLLRERMVFSNIRHILPFLVSFYRHARRGFAAPEMIPLVARAREYGFTDFLRVIAKHDSPWVSRRFLFPALFDRAGGALLTDWVNRSESLAEDLQAMCQRHGFRYHPVSTANKDTGGAHWQSYYDAALVDLVWDTWQREVAIFGFERDGGYRADAPFYRDVVALKARFRYDWRSDVLSGIDG